MTCLHLMASNMSPKKAYRSRHGFNTAAYTQTDPLGGSTEPGSESDITIALLLPSVLDAVGWVAGRAFSL